MKDALWDAAHQAVAPLLRADDEVLAPAGDWPASAASLRLYRGGIEINDATVLLLHKGQLAALRKPDLALIWRTWQCVFANNAFICFTRDRRRGIDRRFTTQRRFMRPLERHLGSEQLRRRAGTVFFLHIPKTAGTSIWHALGRQVPSKAYYASGEAFAFNPPAPGEFDLVGGHIPLHLLLPHLRPSDHLIGLLRDPTARFLSAFLHSRRECEDPTTFTPVMRAMREMELRAFLQTMDAQMELRQQLLMLGFEFDRPYSPALDGMILEVAAEVVRWPRAMFLTDDQIDVFTDRLCKLLGIRPVALRRLNRTDRARLDPGVQEFQAVMPLIEEGNRTERELYALARDHGSAAKREGAESSKRPLSGLLRGWEMV